MLYLGIAEFGEKIAHLVDELLRGLCASLCQLLYVLLSWLYELFMNLTRVEILTTKEIQPIYQRLTMILTIIMVFYVTFEAVKYVVQPDSFTDKEKGGGKLTYKMIMVVILIAFVPTIFTWGYKFQNVIFDNQLFSKIILGKTGVQTSTFGRVFSANVLGMFYYPDTGVWGDKELLEEDNCDGIPCKTVVNANLSSLITDGTLPLMQLGLNDGDEKVDEGVGDVFYYYIHFDGFLALIVGGIVCYMLIIYCIDVGIRVVQLTFLQIIAPIPIIGYLSPKKDGMFQKWVKQCTATYLDLFLRTGIIYFGLLIIQILSDAFTAGTLFNNIPANASNTMKVFIYIALVLAILQFLGKAPKLLGELFPKSGAASGNFGMALKDRSALARGAGMAIGGAFAGAKGLIGGTAARIKRNRANKISGKRAEAKDAYGRAKKNFDDKESAYKSAKAAKRDIKRKMRNGEISQDEGKRQLSKAEQDIRQTGRSLTDARIARASAKAERDNTRYGSVLGSAVAGTVGGTFRGAVSGVQATDAKSIYTKTKDGMKKEADAIRRTEQWYDSGGGNYVHRTVAAVEKSLGINTSSDRIAADIKRYEGDIKSQETLISAESDTKSKRDDVESRLTSKLESGELKATVGEAEEAYLRSKVASDLDIKAGDTVSSIYARYKAKHAEAQSKLDTAIKEGRKPEEIAAAREALEKAAEEETKMKKHAMRAAYTQMLKHPGSGLNDAVAENKLSTMKQSIENAKRSMATIRSFEEATQDALEAAIAAIDNDDTLSAAEKQSAKESITEKFERQLKAFRGEIEFEDYDQLDEIVVRLQNIADERTRQIMAIKETKRMLESSSATTAAKADVQAGGGGK